MIPTEVILAIRDAAQIEQVVGEYIQLKNRGANKLGLCPFHNEKTPSFSVSPSKGIFKCFGCGKAGDSINFVMEHEKLSYPEALRLLAKKYNIDIPEEIESDEARAERHLFDSLYIVNEFAQEYYANNLHETPEGQSIGLSYFKERGFRLETIQKFGLGYSLNSFDAFMKTAVSKSYNLELLKKAGLVKEKNGKTYDFLRDRVMFPIHNLSGKVIAFAGRTLSQDKKIPKYVNSPESEIYVKSKILYGAYLAKKPMIEADNCFLVEGYTDVISLHQAGIKNVVASSGTSLTTEQIRLIKRFTPNITILYDGDSAGVNAAMRGTDMILEADMNVKVVLLPEGEDPDSYVNKVGNDGFIKYVEANAQDFVFFKTNLLVEQTQDDPVKKTSLIRSIVKTLAKIPDPIKRSLYIRQCSKLVEVTEQILINEINKIKHGQFNKYVAQQAPKEEKNEEPVAPQSLPDELKQKPMSLEDTIELLEKKIITLLFQSGQELLKEVYEDEEVEVLLYVLTELEENEIKFSNELYGCVLQEYLNGIESDLLYPITHFQTNSDKKIRDLCNDLLMDPYTLSDNWEKKHNIFIKESDFEKDVVNLLTRLKFKHLQKMMTENQERLKNVTDEEDMIKCMRVQQQLMNKQKVLGQLLGMVVIK